MLDDSSGRGWCIESEGGSLALRRKERSIAAPISNERNSLQFTAKIYVVETMENKENKREEEKPARVLALRGTLSRYVKELELAPGWHRLANGIVAYSDPVAMALTDPRGQIEEAWKARMTLVKDSDGSWRMWMTMWS